MWPLIGAIVLFLALVLLFLGERTFDRARRRRALPKPRDRRLPPGPS